jgi:NAD(P)-dependent dehydrogenase (short-subunit alcohol dehydrogenase family)
MTAASAFGLEGRTAIVTGASSGLGFRFAQVLADAGATVFAAARRADRLQELAATHPGLRPVACDIGAEEDRERLFAEAIGVSGHIDILVNNAGVSGSARIEDEPVDVASHVMDVNLLAAFELCRIAGKFMNPDGGSIINVASVLAFVSGYPLGGAAYSASKGALVALTRELAAQWGTRCIRVNALVPGWFRTEMTEELFADASASRFVNRNTMLQRPGRVDELDGTLLLLAGEAGSYITGQAFVVDGGWTAR